MCSWVIWVSLSIHFIEYDFWCFYLLKINEYLNSSSIFIGILSLQCGYWSSEGKQFAKTLFFIGTNSSKNCKLYTIILLTFGNFKRNCALFFKLLNSESGIVKLWKAKAINLGWIYAFLISILHCSKRLFLLTLWNTQ